jgi:hypothetical protein
MGGLDAGYQWRKAAEADSWEACWHKLHGVLALDKLVCEGGEDPNQRRKGR